MSIESREGANGKRYRFKVYRHGRTFKGHWRGSVAEAKADENEYRKTIDVPPCSLAGCAADYLLETGARRSQNRFEGLRYNFARFILPFFGAKTLLAEVTSERVEDFISFHKARVIETKAGKKELKNITIWHYVKDLKALCNWAITKGRLVENPVARADLSAIRKRRTIKPPLNMQAIDKGIATISGRNRLYCDVLRFMGLRRDEGNRVQVRDVIDYGSEMWLMVRGKKTDASEAVLPIPPVLWPAFRDAVGGLAPDAHPLSTNCVYIYSRRKLFERISLAAGVKVTPKDLRDYFASICSDPVVASQMLRHTGLNTTAVYIRQVRERMRRGVEGLGANSWGQSGGSRH